MSSEQIFAIAREAGLHSAVLLGIYSGKLDALCDSEIEELYAIKRFAELLLEHHKIS